MINSTELKNGTTFLRNNQPYKVIKYALIKMGRGGATVKLSARNLESGATEDISFSSNVKVDSVDTVKKRLQYLYKDTTTGYFMNPESYEQVEIPLSLISEEIVYTKEGEYVNILFWADPPAGEASKALSIDIPPKATFEVTDTDPGVKGNSATNVFKSAKLSNGIEVKVPMFINNGDSIVVDTRDGTYVERAKT